MSIYLSIAKLASPRLWLIIAIIIPLIIYASIINKTLLLEWSLISIISTPINFILILDPKGLIFSAAVLFISANVLQFSLIYIQDDKFINRFTTLVLLFVLSINLLIYLPHFIILLLGWDGLGIVSFILVIYYQNAKSLAAGIITALTNRIGDVILLIAIAWTLNQGHWNILYIWESKFIILQVLAIIVAGITKSAQIPFSSWLPAAIAAPTPVSALVHSSTLVTAGVFLLIRFHPFLSKLSIFNNTILFIAVVTIIIAGVRATTECDIKKIIALSTLRQLGIIITSIGLNLVDLAYFHILTHALFKALLFICAGTLIHFHLHSQDLRWIGNLANKLPITTACIVISNLALSGFPFIAGFYSKDAILEISLFRRYRRIIIILIFLSVGLTSFYSIRFILAVVWGINCSNPYIIIKEYTNVSMPILILSSISVLAGAALIWIIPIKSNLIIMPFVLKIVPISRILLGALYGWYCLTNVNKTSICWLLKNTRTHYASALIWFLVPLSSQFIISAPIYVSHQYLKSVDQSWLELTGGQGINFSLNFITSRIYKHYPLTPTSHLHYSAYAILLIITCVRI